MGVSEPSGATSHTHTLTLVESRIDEVLTGLDALWREVAGRRADVLGDDDLSRLVLAANRGGKRVRPEMAHWGWVASGAPGAAHRQVVELGAAVELLHLFALLHDDVMDRSELRRGHPTCHVVAREAHRRSAATGDPELFGDAVAVLAGDLVHAEADHLVAALPAPVREAWRVMMVELVLGQRRDLTGAALRRRDLDHALEVARLKTGAYTVAGPLRMGALLGGAEQPLLDVLDRWARHAGAAFGLRDDVLGLWGDPRHTGKSVEDDLTAGKATVLLALAEQRLDERGRGLLARTGTGTLTEDELARLREQMTRAGIREMAEDLIGEQVTRAGDVLAASTLPARAVDGLTTTLQRLAWRQA
ncbi:polyprenyl synthetase family protein [Luteococcus sediminum]